MAFHNSGRIVTSGLVLSLDAADRNSYVSGSTTWFDLSQNNYTASLVNGPFFTGSNGGTIVFDGINDYVTGSGSPNFAFGTGDFTVEIWAIYTGGIPIFVDLRVDTLGQGPGYSDYVLNNKFYLFWANANRYTSTGSINVNTWTHIVSTRQSSLVSVYLNGSLDGTSVSNTNLTEGGFRLARNVNNTTYLTGSIASVKMYNRALSAQEVRQNYDAMKSRFNLT